MPARISPIGVVVGKLKVVEELPQRNGRRFVLVRCDCGTIKALRYNSIISGNTKSCGCLQRELTSKRFLRHGWSRIDKTGTYAAWTSMKERCYRTNSKDYHRYGGRGIRVCKRWGQSFENFLADMGPRPKGTSLDRFPNNDGNYEPSNCRWATPREQSNNRRKNIVLSVRGVTDTLAGLCRHFSVPYKRVYYRLYEARMSIEDAFK